MPSFPVRYNLHKVLPTKKPAQETMAAVSAAARTVLQNVKPHIPMIKFPARTGEPIKYSGTPNTGAVESLLSPNMPVPPKGVVKPSASIPKGPILESSQLPLRYRRKPLSPEEMEYIEKGGQV